MQKWIITIIAIIGFLGAAPVLSPRGSDDTGVVIVDLGRKLPQNPNPYITEYERMLWPTVRIKTTNSTGSGVVFDHSKLHISNSKCGMCNLQSEIFILTAAHVVGDNSEVTIEIFSHQDTKTPSSSCLSAFVAMTDTVKDLALLVSRITNRVSQATLAPKDYNPYIFAPVISVGCSLGLMPRPSEGIITVIENSYWEVSSPILPGNSGGPVFDANTYEVIGIAVWVQTYQGQLITTMAGVVPINEIYDFLEKGKQENCKSDDAGR